MAFEKRDLQGSLFYNEKQSDKQPDLKGYVLINGVEYELAAWAGRSGSKVAYSLKAQIKTERRDAPAEQSITQRAQATIRRPDSISSGRSLKSDMDDDIPFTAEFR